MPSDSRPNQFVQRSAAGFAPRIYYFHPLLAGPPAGWPQHTRRAQDLGFDIVLTAPLFLPGSDDDLFLTADHEHAHPVIGPSVPIDRVISEFSEACAKHSLRLYMDIVLGCVAPNARLAEWKPTWFRPATRLGQYIDPRGSLAEPNALLARFDDPSIAIQIADWWIDRLRRLAAAGVTGFGCRDPHLVPAPIWQHVIDGVRNDVPAFRFLAWTPGLTWAQLAELRGVGFDGAFSSVAWWDGRAPWFVEEYELLRGIGAIIGSPEAPFGPRLARRLEGHDQHQTTYRHMLIRAAATGEGLLVPMGFEFGAEHDMSRRGGKPDDLGDIHLPCVSTLAAEIRNGNALVEQLAKLGVTGAIRTLSDPGQQPTALIRTDTADIGHTKNAAVVIINPDLQRTAEFRLSLAPLPPSAGAALVADQTLYSESRPADLMNAGEIRIIRAHPAHPMKLPRPKMAPHTVASHRVVIDNVSPAIDRGRFAAKRVIGEPIAIEADVLTDGHELLAVETLWRAIDEKGWRRVPMQHLGNDRWQTTILPDRIGRYRFTIEARWDKYGTFCRDLNLKRRAGADITLEITEGCELLKGAQARAQPNAGGVIASALNRLNGASANRAQIFFYLAI